MPDPPCTLAAEHIDVTVLPGLGARLHRLTAFGVDLLRTPDDPGEHARDPFFWGGYHMAPWCNRLDTAPVIVRNRSVRLRPNFTDGTAIHGQVYAVPWRTVDEGVDEGTFTVSGGGHGWPWTYDVTLHLAVAAATVTLTYTLTNTSDAPMPAGIGFHPWFREPLTVRIPAARAFPVNASTAPQPEPVTGDLDLRDGRPLPAGVDATWVGLSTSCVTLTWPMHGISMTMRTEAAEAVVVAANPSDLHGSAVELQTHAPAGLRRLVHGQPYGLRQLDPGASLRLHLALTFSPHAAGP